MKMNPDADAVFLVVARILCGSVKEKIVNGRRWGRGCRYTNLTVVIVDRDPEAGAR
jgi:hypothetical protein